MSVQNKVFRSFLTSMKRVELWHILDQLEDPHSRSSWKKYELLRVLVSSYNECQVLNAFQPSQLQKIKVSVAQRSGPEEEEVYQWIESRGNQSIDIGRRELSLDTIKYALGCVPSVEPNVRLIAVLFASNPLNSFCVLCLKDRSPSDVMRTLSLDAPVPAPLVWKDI